MTGRHRSRLDRLQDLTARYQFTRGAGRDGESAAGHSRHRGGEHLSATPDGVQRGWPARRHLPVQLGEIVSLERIVQVCVTRRTCAKRQCSCPDAGGPCRLQEAAATDRLGRHRFRVFCHVLLLVTNHPGRTSPADGATLLSAEWPRRGTSRFHTRRCITMWGPITGTSQYPPSVAKPTCS